MVRSQHSPLLSVGLAVVMAATVVVPARALAQEGTVAAVDALATLDDTSVAVINMILVRVNGDPILLSEVRDTVDNQMELLRASLPEEEIQAQLPAIRMSVLQGMIDAIMMQQRADRLGITIGANDVDRYVQQVRDNNGFASDEDLAAELAKIGMTMEGLREQAREQLAQNRLVFEEVQRGVFVTETQIVEYYNEHQDDFRNPEQVRLEQLVFIGSAPQLADQAAAAAQELQGGADLETVGGKYVDATPVADNGTFIAVSDLTEALGATVPNMPTGSFSDPIATKFGLSIVKVLERTDQQTATLDEVRENIRNRLTSQRSQELLDAYLSDLRGETRLEILDPRLTGLDEAWKTQEADETAGQR